MSRFSKDNATWNRNLICHHWLRRQSWRSRKGLTDFEKQGLLFMTPWSIFVLVNTKQQQKSDWLEVNGHFWSITNWFCPGFLLRPLFCFYLLSKTDLQSQRNSSLVSSFPEKLEWFTEIGKKKIGRHNFHNLMPFWTPCVLGKSRSLSCGTKSEKQLSIDETKTRIMKVNWMAP